VRHKNSRTILFLLWAFAFLSYLLRINIAVAQQYMARELYLSDLQVGYIFTAFLVGYSIFQVPAGVLGDRFGPRIILTVSGLFWGLTTLLTGLVPGLLLKGLTASLGALLLLRFLHGLGEAATYPVAMTAVSIWFPASRHAFVTAIIFTGSTLGSAFAPPFVASVMSRYGWRFTFYISSLLPVFLAIAWWQLSRRPVDRTAIEQSQRSSVSFRAWFRLLQQSAILALCSSYLLYCYAISIFVYWLFKYLVDVRHLSVVNSGWATSLPWIVASVAVPVSGYISARLSERIGTLKGRRLVATSCLVVSAVLMSVGASSQRLALALTAISICVGLLFSTESSYWSTAIELAAEEAGAASGLMNLAGNLGGVLSTFLVPLLVMHFGWIYALSSGSMFALVAAILWFLIKQPKTK
jgi:ACS family glucarate transporter-like MFS transporter